MTDLFGFLVFNFFRVISGVGVFSGVSLLCLSWTKGRGIMLPPVKVCPSDADHCEHPNGSDVGKKASQVRIDVIPAVDELVNVRDEILAAIHDHGLIIEGMLSGCLLNEIFLVSLLGNVFLSQSGGSGGSGAWQQMIGSPARGLERGQKLLSSGNAAGDLAGRPQTSLHVVELRAAVRIVLEGLNTGG